MNPQTMCITGSDGAPLMINTADFDPTTQTPFGQETPAPVDQDQTSVITGTEPRTGVVNVGNQVTFADGGVVTAPVTLVGTAGAETVVMETPAAAVPPEMFVTKQGAKKFIVSDREGKVIEFAGIEPNGYATEAAAWAAIMAVRNNG